MVDTPMNTIKYNYNESRAPHFLFPPGPQASVDSVLFKNVMEPFDVIFINSVFLADHLVGMISSDVVNNNRHALPNLLKTLMNDTPKFSS